MMSMGTETSSSLLLFLFCNAVDDDADDNKDRVERSRLRPLLLSSAKTTSTNSTGSFISASIRSLTTSTMEFITGLVRSYPSETSSRISLIWCVVSSISMSEYDGVCAPGEDGAEGDASGDGAGAEGDVTSSVGVVGERAGEGILSGPGRTLGQTTAAFCILMATSSPKANGSSVLRCLYRSDKITVLM